LEVARHKTALSRTELSRPVRQALADAVVKPGTTVFDFGCGLGGDVRRLCDSGYDCVGWDPTHRPTAVRRASDIVNIGYVVNVIERPEERAEALREAWSLARKVLVVAARLKEEAKGTPLEAYEDGGLTRTGTFQKFFDQSELREWINQVLGVGSVAAAPGVFYVFREEAEREAFLATRFRRRSTAPRLRRSDVLFEQHRAVLEPLMAFLAERGRLPGDEELPEAAAIRDAVGSLKQAFRLIQRVTGQDQWQQVNLERAEDLLVYVGLARFDRRPKMSALSKSMQFDVRAFFGNYTRACEEADELLFALGQRELLQAALAGAEVGKGTPNGLYVHASAVSSLPTLLRLFEGCARTFLGAVEGANIIKLHRESPQVSYLSYPEFDKAPHPALASSVIVDLQTFRVAARDYSQSKNPPILHRKELFVSADYPLREKFERLTRQEEKAGLYDSTDTIGTRDGWLQALKSRSVQLRGHRLVISRG
jgi:DNA phosphorothioation-associated putative methyltransferase